MDEITSDAPVKGLGDLDIQQGVLGNENQDTRLGSN